MTHFRNNRTEKCKLAYEHKQIDRMISQKLKEQRIESFKLNRELAKRSKAITPSVDSFLDKQSKRYVQHQVKDQVRNTRMYEDFCKENVKKFKELRLPIPEKAPLFLLEVLIDEEKIARERQRILELERKAAEERDKKILQDEEDDYHDETDEESSDNEINSTEEDKDSNATYHGRRRFTMTAYGAMPQFAGDARRVSNTAISDLAAILQVQESNTNSSNNEELIPDYGYAENQDIESTRRALDVIAETKEEINKHDNEGPLKTAFKATVLETVTESNEND